MKRFLLSFLLLFSLFSAFSQNQKNVEHNQFTLNVLLPGLIYEAGIADNATLAGEATMGFALRGCTGCNTDFGIYPIGRLQYRYYYNFDRRRDLGKNITGNTGNYIAPTLVVQGGRAIIGNLDYASDYFGGVGAVYGLQRTGKKGLQFRFEVGPAYFFDEFNSDFGLLLAMKLGFVLRKDR